MGLREPSGYFCPVLHGERPMKVWASEKSCSTSPGGDLQAFGPLKPVPCCPSFSSAFFISSDLLCPHDSHCPSNASFFVLPWHVLKESNEEMNNEINISLINTVSCIPFTLFLTFMPFELSLIVQRHSCLLVYLDWLFVPTVTYCFCLQSVQCEEIPFFQDL